MTETMPPHRVEGYDCRGASVPGYVHHLPDGRLHCNRCGYVADLVPRDDVTPVVVEALPPWPCCGAHGHHADDCPTLDDCNCVPFGYDTRAWHKVGARRGCVGSGERRG